MPEIVIEAGNAKNQAIMFQPTSETLRGRWSNANIPGQEMRPAIRQMPEIPGIHIAVDVESRVCRRYDPLVDDRATWEQIDRIIDENSHQLEKSKPWPEVRVDDCDDDQIKTWLWWMRRLVDSGKARVKNGSLPGLDAILEMPGSARIGQFNSVVTREITAEGDSTFGKQAENRRARRRRETTKQKATNK